jgi:hypothetical protein
MGLMNLHDDPLTLRFFVAHSGSVAGGIDRRRHTAFAGKNCRGDGLTSTLKLPVNGGDLLVGKPLMRP